MYALAAQWLRDLVAAVLTELFPHRKSGRHVCDIPESNNVHRSIHEGNELILTGVLGCISYPPDVVTPTPFDTS